MEEWKEYKLKDIIQFNPLERIPKGTKCRKIGMDQLSPFCRYVYSNNYDLYKGGTKFRNGDTIMARITPCLENGKTAYVSSLGDDEVAFGSTEFIVMRKIENVSDSKFIYYLSISPTIRDIAIKSMIGSSGRQRVQQDVLENLKMKLPSSLDDQIRIANILSSLDDKIELNNRINANLEEQAQALFRRWFVDFEFPNEKGFPYKSNGGKFIDSELGRIPEGWTVGNLSTIANIVSGKRPLHKCNIKKGESIIPIIGASSIMGYTTDMLYNEEILIIGRVGTLGVVQRISGPCWTSDNTLVIKSLYKEYIYQLLNRIKYTNINRGSTQPLITQTDMKNTKIFIPDDKILYSFEKLVSQMFACCKENITQNVNIARLRNTLLPKLMNNEI